MLCLSGPCPSLPFLVGRDTHRSLAALLQIPENTKVLPEEHPRSQAVRQIINTLAEKVNTLDDVPPHLKNIKWNVTVVESKVVNALAAPGGHVLVFTGTYHCPP